MNLVNHFSQENDDRDRECHYRTRDRQRRSEHDNKCTNYKERRRGVQQGTLTTRNGECS